MAPPVFAVKIYDKRFTGQPAVMQIFYATPCAGETDTNRCTRGSVRISMGRVMPL